MVKAKTIKKRNQALNIAVIIIDTIVLVRTIFHFAMALTGNWDDINIATIMILVSLGIVALFLSLVNNVKYKGHPSYILASVITLGLAAMLFVFILFNFSFDCYIYRLASTAAQVASSLSAGMTTVT